MHRPKDRLRQVSRMFITMAYFCLMMFCGLALVGVILPFIFSNETVQLPAVSVPGVTDTLSCCPQDTWFSVVGGTRVHLAPPTTPAHAFMSGSDTQCPVSCNTEFVQDICPTPCLPAISPSPTKVCSDDFGAMRRSSIATADWASSTTPPETSVAAPLRFGESGTGRSEGRLRHTRYGEDAIRDLNDDRVPQPVCLIICFIALVFRVYTGNPLRGVRRRRRLERRSRAKRHAVQSAAKRRAREAAISGGLTASAVDVLHDVDKRVADLTRKLRLARRAASLRDVAVRKLDKTVTLCAAKDLGGESALVFVKGDANYRRLIGDRLWPTDTPFSDVAGYFPTRLCALRTLKAELGCGMPKEATERGAQQHEDWMVNGRCGCIQLFDPATD